MNGESYRFRESVRAGKGAKPTAEAQPAPAPTASIAKEN